MIVTSTTGPVILKDLIEQSDETLLIDVASTLGNIPRSPERDKNPEVKLSPTRVSDIEIFEMLGIVEEVAKVFKGSTTKEVYKQIQESPLLSPSKNRGDSLEPTNNGTNEFFNRDFLYRFNATFRTNIQDRQTILQEATLLPILHEMQENKMLPLKKMAYLTNALDFLSKNSVGYDYYEYPLIKEIIHVFNCKTELEFHSKLYSSSFFNQLALPQNPILKLRTLVKVDSKEVSTDDLVDHFNEIKSSPEILLVLLQKKVLFPVLFSLQTMQMGAFKKVVVLEFIETLCTYLEEEFDEDFVSLKELNAIKLILERDLAKKTGVFSRLTDPSPLQVELDSFLKPDRSMKEIEKLIAELLTSVKETKSFSEEDQVKLDFLIELKERFFYIEPVKAFDLPSLEEMST